MKYIIQHNLLNIECLNTIRKVMVSNSLPHAYVGIIPFSREITSDEPLVGIDYLPYGSTTLTMETYNLGWKGQYFNPATFRAEVWNEKRDDMLNNAITTTIAEAITFLRMQDPNSFWFTRPTEDLKTFSGQVIAAKECVEWFEDAMTCTSSGSYKLEPETPIVLCEPKNIQAEWRWFVVGGRVIDGSVYRLNGQLTKKHEEDCSVIEEAQRFADKWLPSPCCVMDLAWVDNQIKVIEFNTINSSGFYDHNIEKILVELYNYSVGS